MPEPPGYLELISCGLHSSLERERNICRRLITSSIKREIRHFHFVVVQRRQRNVQKACRTCKVDGLLYNPITFLTFSLPSLSSFLKLPSNQGWLRLRRRSVGFGNYDGGYRGGAWPPAPLIFRPNWGLKGQLHPPYLRVWMTAAAPPPPTYFLTHLGACGPTTPPLTTGVVYRSPPPPPAAYLRVWIRNWELQNFLTHFGLFL